MNSLIKRSLHTRSVIPLHSIYSTPSGPHNEKQPILVHIHGAFGSSQDFRAYNKKMAASLSAPVYSVDLRNHGKSPSVLPYDNWTLAGDVAEFVCKLSKKYKNRKVDLVGFSLGAKVALLTGAYKSASSIINKIVSIDMPAGKLKQLDDIVMRNTSEIIKTLQVSEKYISSRGQLSKMEHPQLFVKKSKYDKTWAHELNNHFLEVNNGDRMITAYFTSGFHSASQDLRVGEPVKFNMPLLDMKQYLEAICDWPTDIFKTGDPSKINQIISSPTLFLKATQSAFFAENKGYMEVMHQHYPNHKIESFESPHAIHVHKQDEYINSVINFLKV